MHALETPLARMTLAAAFAFAAMASFSPEAHAQGMQAGGLAPPPPLPPASQPAPSYEDSSSGGSSDSGRGLSWVYVEAEGGFQHVGLRTFNVDEQNFSAGFIETQSSGPVIGVGAGVRLLFLTLGARGRVGFFNAWDLFSVGGELGLRIPIGNLEPRFDLGGGYAALGSVRGALQSGDSATLQSAFQDAQIRGFYIRAGAGLDYYVTKYFSVGAQANFEVLGLTRPGLDPTKVTQLSSDPNLSTAEQARAEVLKAEGSSYGAAGTATAVLGLHF